MNITSDHVKAYFARVQPTLTKAERDHVEKALSRGYPMVQWAHDHYRNALRAVLEAGRPDDNTPPTIEFYDHIIAYHGDDVGASSPVDSPSAPQLQGYDDLRCYVEKDIAYGIVEVGEQVEWVDILDVQRTAIRIGIFNVDHVIF